MSGSLSNEDEDRLSVLSRVAESNEQSEENINFLRKE